MHLEELMAGKSSNTKLPANILHLTNWSLIKISGEQAENFLQGQLTCDVAQIDEQQSSLAALCNHQGRVLAVSILLKIDDDYFCFLPSEICEQFITHLKKFAVFSKVTVEDVSQHFFLYGCINIERDSSFESLVLREKIILCHLRHTSKIFLMISRKSLSEELSVSENDMLWRLGNILSGIPFVYAQTINTFTPHMLNLPELGAVSFTKGCYVGQEIIARTQYLGKSKRHLCRAELDSSADIKPGEVVSVDNQESGLVVDAGNFNEKTHLLVVLQEPLDRTFVVNNLTLNVALMQR